MSDNLSEKDLEQGIIRNIRRLSTFIDDAYLKSERDKYFHFQSDFKVFHKQIEILYQKWFPRAKPCKDEEIINQVFRMDVPEKAARIWVKHSMACLLNSASRIYSNLEQTQSDKDDELFLCEMGFLREFSFEAAMFMETAFSIIEKKAVDFGLGKRFSIHSKETFDASRQLLRKFVAPKTFGDFVLSPSSIFLIRQSIELWLKEIFGIRFVTDGNDKLIRLQPERLFELIDKKSVTIPVSKSVIQKIHQWTQAYVHAGWLTFAWEIEHAHHVLSPIFYSEKVIIEKAYYDNIEERLRTILREPTLILHRSNRPACKMKN